MSEGALIKPSTVYAIKIDAGNDRSGNPRRGWLVYDTAGDLICFVDEGYAGERAVKSRFPKVVVLASLPVPYGAYREARNWELESNPAKRTRKRNPIRAKRTKAGRVRIVVRKQGPYADEAIRGGWDPNRCHAPDYKTARAKRLFAALGVPLSDEEYVLCQQQDTGLWGVFGLDVSGHKYAVEEYV